MNSKNKLPLLGRGVNLLRIFGDSHKMRGWYLAKNSPGSKLPGDSALILHFSQGNSDTGRAAGIIERQLDIGGEGLASGQPLDVGQQEGGDLLAVDVLGIGQPRALVMMPSM